MNLAEWTREQELLLIDELLVFKEAFKSLNSDKLYSHLTAALREKGYKFSEKQVNNKVENLKKKLKKVYEWNSRTGGKKMEWEFYDVSVKFLKNFLKNDTS